MKLLDIKNNLVKISYKSDENIAIASFIMLTDEDKSFVAQIVNLKAEPVSNYAIARLILIVSKDGVLDNYDGSIPSINANLEVVDSKELLSLLPVEKPVIMGEIAQKHQILKLDESIFEKHLLICAEKYTNINTIISNFVRQLNKNGEKTVIIDTDYTFEENHTLKLIKDFKIPLNSTMLEYIFENDLQDTDATSRAVIQEILEDVIEYARSVEFIPFKKFFDIISGIYEQNQIPELALLKNKLLKYNEKGIFAENEDEILNLEYSIRNNLQTYIDIADIPESMQIEVIDYIHQKMVSVNEYIYNFVKLNNHNSNKQLLLKLSKESKIFTTMICSHNYKYVAELKQLAENIILFSPQTTQHDFANYNTFLSKLNANEFVVYGDLTQNIPFVAELAPLDEMRYEETSPNTTIEEEEIEENQSIQTNLQEQHTNESINNFFENTTDPELQTESGDNFEIEAQNINLDTENIENSNEEIVEQVAKDVDELLFENKMEGIPPIENILSDTDGNITEEDLDFIDDLPQDTETIIMEEPTTEEIPTDYSLENTESQQNWTQSQDFNTDSAIEDNQNVVIDIQETNPTEELSLTESEPDILNMDNSIELEEPLKMNETPGFEDALELAEPTGDDIPVFSAEEDLSEPKVNFEQGDEVSHPKYGKGVIEKLIKYGNKTLCSISFEEVGRRLLDPSISELQKL